MKKFIQKIQSLGQRATELKEAVQQVPPKVAGIREAVALTTGQLRDLSTQVRNSVLGLKADQEDQLLAALREINDSSGIIRQAGFELGGIDFELSPVERLIVHLDRREDVRKSVLEALRDASQARPTVRALLESLMRAEEAADQVRLSDLDYRTLIVHVGPVPTVRLCWRPSGSLSQAKRPGLLSEPTPARPAAAAERPSFFGSAPPGTSGLNTAEQASEPEQPPSASAAPPPRELVPEPQRASPPAPATPEVSLAKETAPVWNSDALQRFKTMPKASKYRR